MNNTNMTEAEWDALSPQEQRAIIDDHQQAYLDELSPEDYARVLWQNGPGL